MKHKFMLLLRYVFMIKNVSDSLFNLRLCNSLMFKRKDDELQCSALTKIT